MALESVDYSEEKACRILEIVMQDDKGVKTESKQEVKEEPTVENESTPNDKLGTQAENIPNAVNNNDER